MNTVNQNGVKVTQTEYSVTVNGREYPLPEKWNGQNNLVVRNGEVWVNGYRLNQDTGEFTRPVSLLWIAAFALVFIALYYNATR